MGRTLRRLLPIVLLILAAFPQVGVAQVVLPREPWPGPRPAPQPEPWPIRPAPITPVELRLHRVEVEIKDQVATTTVEQVFFNPTSRRLEGSYLFPLPAGAQIDRFTLEIDGKAVEAELLPADKARGIYLDIVRRLADPALLEYAGCGLLRLRVFPIEARGERRVELRYTELLTRDGGLTSYTYPAATGRLSSIQSAAARPADHRGRGTFALRARLETTRPLETLYSPSHTVEARREGDRRATVGLEGEVGDGVAETDFQLFFAQRPPEGGGVSLELLSYGAPEPSWRRGDARKGGRSEDGTFLLLASPGELARKDETVARDLVFVLDTSGSMAGAKLEQAKRALTFCLENLNAEDRFEIVRFSTDVEPLFGKLVAASRANRDEARAFLEELRPIGGTAIDDALRAAVAPASARPAAERDRPYVLIFLTDGRPTLGATNTEEILRGVPRGVSRDDAHGDALRVFPFGIGTDVNTHLLDRLAEDSRGRSQYVLADEDIELEVSSFYRKISRPVLVDLRVTFGEGVRVSQLYPRELPDLFDGEQLVVFGRYRGGGDVAVTLEGRAAGRPYRQVDEARFAPSGKASREDRRLAFLPRLWAVRRVGFLLDEIRLHGESAELREEVAELARRYGIVTPYTSYLIVEDEARRDVPHSLRSQRQLEEAPEMLRVAEDNYQLMTDATTGDDAVGSARSNEALKRAEGLSAPRESAAAAGPAATPGFQQAQQRPRLVAGKAFYQNGSQWVDTDAQEAISASREQRQQRVAFNSAAYFQLLEDHPEAQQWLSVGRNVLLLVDDTVYEVYEE